MPRKEELYMNKTQVQRLCELYQEEEHLWNIQSPHYFKKDKRHAALNRIKDGLEAEHDDLPNFTIEQLWTKLANLRSYYSRELKKVNDSKKSGTGTDEVYTSSWNHFEILDKFLRTQVVPRESQTNLDTSSLAHDQMDNEDEDDETMSQGSAHSEERCETPTSITMPRRLAGKKSPFSGPETVMQEAASVLAQIKARRVENQPPPPLPKADDEDDIFGKHVASEMKRIKDPLSKGMARVKIQSTLFEAQFHTQAPSTAVSHQSRESHVSQSALLWQGASQNYNTEDVNSSHTLFRL